MNRDKRLKPNLVDHVLEKKIIKTLNPPKEDYWAPTKNIFQNFYQNYIKPNISVVIFIIIILLLLLYRYKTTQTRRTKRQNEYVNDNQLKHNFEDTNINNDYTKLLLSSYNQQKEILREPKINVINQTKNTSGLAYPVYPHTGGGKLIPSKR